MNLGSGPIPAKIMIVGEAWGADEDARKEPFVGVSGQELNRMLHEANIMRSEVYCTNVVNARPRNNDMGQWIALKKKDQTLEHFAHRGKWVKQIVLDGLESLRKEIELVKPNVIIAAGGLALWALTGKNGILKWRGSTLRMEPLGQPTAGELLPKVIPIIHPAAILREWSARAITVNDLKRVRPASLSREIVKPEWHFIIRPSFEMAVECLKGLLAIVEDTPEGLWIDFDLETRAGHITTCGLSWSNTHAISIPLMCREDEEGYWLPELEGEIVYLLYKLLTHKNAFIRGQNLLYDAQYTYRHWHFVPNVKQDTMISMHTLFAGLRKALDFQASMFCEFYQNWKPDKSAWAEGK